MNNIKEDKNKMILLFMIHKNKDLCKEEHVLHQHLKEEKNIKVVLHFLKKNINYVKN